MRRVVWALCLCACDANFYPGEMSAPPSGEPAPPTGAPPPPAVPSLDPLRVADPLGPPALVDPPAELPCEESPGPPWDLEPPGLGDCVLPGPAEPDGYRSVERTSVDDGIDVCSDEHIEYCLHAPDGRVLVRGFRDYASCDGHPTDDFGDITALYLDVSGRVIRRVGYYGTVVSDEGQFVADYTRDEAGRVTHQIERFCREWFSERFEYARDCTEEYVWRLHRDAEGVVTAADTYWRGAFESRVVFGGRACPGP